MKIWPDWLGDRRQILAKLPFIAGMMIVQAWAEYYIYGHINPTLAIIAPPIFAYCLFNLILRWPWPASSRLPAYPFFMAAALTFGAWWAGFMLAVNTYGT